MPNIPTNPVTAMSVALSKSERIDVRATPPVKQLLQEAARVAHKNVSEFLLDAGIVAANQTLADRRRFELPPEQWAAFEAALDQPVAPFAQRRFGPRFVQSATLERRHAPDPTHA